MMMRSSILLGLLVVGCGGSGETPPDAGAGTCDPACPTGEYCTAEATCAPGCAYDAECGAGKVCTEAHTCELGGCGGEHLDLTYVTPRMMVVLDRSCSMDKTPAGATKTKWASAVGALDAVLTTHTTDIAWGLTLFPDTTGDTCGQDTVQVPIASGQAGAIQTLLTGALSPTDPLFPDYPCTTNIDTGVITAATDPALADPAHARYLMLVTDGAQSSCNLGGSDAGTEEAIRALRVQHGVTTFVVGFGGGVDVAQLNKFATIGGAPLPGTTKYYRADTASQLDQAFQSIAELVVSCDYVVDPAPADLAQTWVYFDGTELIPRDTTHAAGWDFDEATSTLTLHGADCTRLQARTVSDVDVVFGCPSPPVL